LHNLHLSKGRKHASREIQRLKAITETGFTFADLKVGTKPAKCIGKSCFGIARVTNCGHVERRVGRRMRHRGWRIGVAVEPESGGAPGGAY